jgi:hypothetical protein
MPLPARRARPRLGEMLVELGYLNGEQLNGALAHQRQWGMSFGRAALARGYCNEDQILEALVRQTGLRGVDLEKEEQAPEVRGLLSHEAAQQHRAVALKLSAHTLMVAMAAPASLNAQDAIRALTGRSRLDVVIASDEALERAIARFYGQPSYEAAQSQTETHAAFTESSPTPIPQGQPMAPPLKRPELFDTIGLTTRTSDIVMRMCRAHNLSHRELLARIVEEWAANLMKSQQKR